MATTKPTAPTATEQQISWLIDTYGETLYRVAIAIVHDREVAEDVVQEVLVKAWTSMPSWDGDVPIRWARTVTKNTALNAVRSARSRPTGTYDPRDTRLPSAASVDEEFERNESAAELWTILSHLDGVSKLLLVLHEIDELTYNEIAATTDLTTSAVKSKIYRARLALRNEVRR